MQHCKNIKAKVSKPTALAWVVVAVVVVAVVAVVVVVAVVAVVVAVVVIVVVAVVVIVVAVAAVAVMVVVVVVTPPSHFFSGDFSGTSRKARSGVSVLIFYDLIQLGNGNSFGPTPHPSPHRAPTSKLGT